MKAPLIFLLIVALVLAQGLRLCVHAPGGIHGGEAHASQVHYESDSETDADDGGNDFDVTYVLQGMDSHTLLAGMSAFTLLLIALLFIAGQNRLIPAAYSTALRRPDGARLRPPLRAPPL